MEHNNISPNTQYFYPAMQPLPQQGASSCIQIFYPRMFSPVPATINPLLLHRQPSQDSQEHLGKRKIGEIEKEPEKEKEVPNPYILNNPLKKARFGQDFNVEQTENTEFPKEEIFHSFVIEAYNDDNPIRTFFIEEQSKIHIFEINESTLQRFPECSLATTCFSALNPHNDARIQLYDIKPEYLRMIFSYMLSGLLIGMENYDINETFGLISACKKICCEGVVAEIDAKFIYTGNTPEENQHCLSKENIFLVLNWVFYYATNENEYFLLNNIFNQCRTFLGRNGIFLKPEKGQEGQDTQEINDFFARGMVVSFSKEKALKFFQSIKIEEITPFPFPTIIEDEKLLYRRHVRQLISKLFPHCFEMSVTLDRELIKCRPAANSDLFTEQFKNLKTLYLHLNPAQISAEYKEKSVPVKFHEYLKNSNFVKLAQQSKSIFVNLHLDYRPINRDATFNVLQYFPHFMINFFTKNVKSRPMEVVDYDGVDIFGGWKMNDKFLENLIQNQIHSLHMENLRRLNKFTFLSDDNLAQIIESNPQLEIVAFDFRVCGEPNRLLYSIRGLKHLRKIIIRLDLLRKNEIPSITGFFADLPTLEQIDFVDQKGISLSSFKKPAFFQ